MVHEALGRVGQSPGLPGERISLPGFRRGSTTSISGEDSGPPSRMQLSPNDTWYLYFELQVSLDLSVVQLLSCVWLLASPWPEVCQATLYPSPSPGVCSDPCPLSRWCHPTISSSAVPFCFCLRSFTPAQIQILPLLTKTWRKQCRSIYYQRRTKLVKLSSEAIQSKVTVPPACPDSETFSETVFPGPISVLKKTWGLLHCRQILYQLSHKGSPEEWNPGPFA